MNFPTRAALCGSRTSTLTTLASSASKEGDIVRRGSGCAAAAGPVARFLARSDIWTAC
jgi:hypothetical protein